MPRRLPLRLIITVALTTLAVVAACSVVIHMAGRRAVYRQQVNDLDHVAQLVREWVPPDGRAAGEQDRARLRDLARVLGVRVTLIGDAGDVLLDTDASANVMDNHNRRPEVARARAAGVGDDQRRSDTINEWSVYVARLVDPARPGGAVVRVSQWRTPPPGLTASLLAVVAAAAVSGLGAGLVLWLLLRKQWIAPIQAVREAVRQMAGGEWTRRATASGSDDVRALVAELNEMASAGQRQAQELRYQQAQVRSLADTIPDAVLVSDVDDRIALLNAPAAALLGVKPEHAVGEKLVKVVGDEALLGLIESVRQGRGSRPPAAGAANADGDAPRQVRLVRDGQHVTLQAHAERTAAGGALVVLRDVSTLSETVQMKADFVANASHELRTPIAAIKIAYETLREVHREDPDQTDRCLQIIDGHMTRLEEMLRDLLDLSRVESAEMKPFVRELVSTDLFASLKAALGPLARQKLVELAFDTGGGGDHDDGPVTFFGDERLLNLVMKNLVENSIKFTPPGGSVTVTVARTHTPADTVSLTVSDTGVGIPPEHLDRVFERFYQVDPARSGSAGRGTGLGLAIVKHAVHAMGGTVQLRSALGRGTVVAVTIPQAAPAAAASADQAVRG
jgi:two-component system phosphate regulon sensor histidine kinase PhoR